MCTPTILKRIEDSTNFNNWKGVTSTSLNSITLNSASGSLSGSSDLSILMKSESEIFATAACLQEEINTLSGTTNNIQAAQSELLNLSQQIADKEADIKVARDRVAYIRHPEAHTSYYESWFPMGRPMHTSGIPYFIGISVSILLFTIFILLSILGVRISIATNTTTTSPMVAWIVSQITPFAVMCLIALISVVIYFMTRK